MIGEVALFIGALFYVLVVGGLIFLLGYLYFLPTLISYKYKHEHFNFIFVVNLFFGFSILGWIACLFWALMKDYHKQKN